MHIDAIPFTGGAKDQWEPGGLGPVWVERWPGHRFTPDQPVGMGMRLFIKHLSRIAPPEQVYGTLYAVRLDEGAVSAGELHYDLGEYAPGRGATRYVATWASDSTKLSNVFLRPEFHRPEYQGRLVGSAALDDRLFVTPPNRQIVVMHEGRDLHGRAAVPARPGQWGVFISAALYADNEPANLHCPRLSDLRERGPRAAQALRHRHVARSAY